MPSQRRMRVFGLLVVLVVLITLYVTGSARSTQKSEFYVRTSAALRGQPKPRSSEKDAAHDEKMSTRLKEAERLAKISADRKGRQLQEKVLEGMAEEEKRGTSVAGRIHISEEAENQIGADLRGQAPLHIEPASLLEDKEKTDEDESGQVDILDSILAKNPITIFSKTFCPFSKKAKAILLDQYRIEPIPQVIELDEIEAGPAIQELLGARTGRTTVPNIIVGGHSIGGGDEVQALHEGGRLTSTIKEYGDKLIETAELIVAARLRRFKG